MHHRGILLVDHHRQVYFAGLGFSQQRVNLHRVRHKVRLTEHTGNGSGAVAGAEVMAALGPLPSPVWKRPEAELHAAEDQAKREEIEARNNADNLAYQAEKSLRDNADKIPADRKGEVDTKVQAVRTALQGQDVIGIASTGTGKTAAFALPILHKLATSRMSQALVIAPTRELAAHAEALASAITTLHDAIRAAQDESVRRAGFRCDTATGWTREAAGELHDTAGDLDRIAAAAAPLTSTQNAADHMPLPRARPPRRPALCTTTGGQPFPASETASMPNCRRLSSSGSMGRCRMRGTPSRR